jgi:uncharacterized protein
LDSHVTTFGTSGDVKTPIIVPTEVAAVDAYGMGVAASRARRYQDALMYLLEASKEGNVSAKVQLGNLYRDGTGVKQDLAQARRLYEEAANTGNVSAMDMLAFSYVRNDLPDNDFSKAAIWYEKADAAGSLTAAWNAGGMYEDGGPHLKRDYQQALKWYERAAALHDGNAMFRLGRLYEHGHGVPKDHAMAKEWYEKAAAAGSREAQTRLRSSL